MSFSPENVIYTSLEYSYTTWYSSESHQLCSPAYSCYSYSIISMSAYYASTMSSMPIFIIWRAISIYKISTMNIINYTISIIIWIKGIWISIKIWIHPVNQTISIIIYSIICNIAWRVIWIYP